MRLIIPCAGDGGRWLDPTKNDLPKHLVPLCGEPVLERTVRLASQYLPDADVRIVVEDSHDHRYAMKGARRVKAKLNPSNGDVDKLLSSRHLWDDERTIVLFGDVWWSEPAFKRVAAAETVDGWTVFLRFGPNGDGGEIFGFVFDAEAYDAVDEAMAQVTDAKGRGGWSVYRVLAGGDPNVHADLGHAEIIDDWTEDMDEPRDWHHWCYRYAKASPQKRAGQGV